MNVVTFTLHQRPFYTRQVLSAWSRVRGVDEWAFQFHIDPSTQVEAQLNVIEDFGHPNVEVFVNSEHLGVLRNPKKAIQSAFDVGAGYVVLAEEDVEPADDALEYFEYARSRPQLLAACAWTDQDANPALTFRKRWFNPWLWGCNLAAWEEVLAPTWDEDYSSGDERGPGGWDCNIGLRVVQDRFLQVLFPGASRAQHIGQWLGVHQDPSHFGVVEKPLSFRAHREPVQFTEA